jgi:hypothetical protein
MDYSAPAGSRWKLAPGSLTSGNDHLCTERLASGGDHLDTEQLASEGDHLCTERLASGGDHLCTGGLPATAATSVRTHGEEALAPALLRG